MSRADWDWFGFPFGFAAMGHRHRRGRGRRQWFESGDMKYVILKLLREKPMHGYEVMKALEERPITEEERSYWAFQKPVRRDPPAASNGDWNSNASDRFLFTKFKEKGLEASPQADRRTLIRRV